jgi:hypothetical protein
MIIIFFSVIYFAGCSDDPASPGGDDSVPENNIPNMSKEEVPSESSGGDPRGTYFANEPYFLYFSNSTSVQVIDSVNKARAMYRFEGSATSGTYVELVELVEVRSIRIRVSGSTTDTTMIRMQSSYSPARKVEGTWRVSADTLYLTVRGAESATAYTANNKGIFFITKTNAPLVGVYSEVYAYKKRP